VLSLAAAAVFGACASFGSQTAGGAKTPDKPNVTAQDRLAILRRAQVWTPIDTRALDIKRGPQATGAFAAGQTVACDYVDRKLSGRTPKFACAISADDEVKVKYGLDNGEVYGEVAATRLLWALGFGADRMYPVRVVCRGCPSKITGAGVTRTAKESILEPAVIERKAPGHEVETHEAEGWSWKELDLVDEAVGGAPLAHRDALKLVAVLMQHADTKPGQQRLVCMDELVPARGGEACGRPFMLINDVGVTFGRSDIFNRNTKGSVNFDRWASAPVWKEKDGCVGNLAKSLTGTLQNPVISEPGRQFLADLLGKLSDAQIHDLFDVSRVTLRPSPEGDKAAQVASIDDWANAFKKKRDEVSNRRCAATQ
jgi:hypothetical protein